MPEHYRIDGNPKSVCRADHQFRIEVRRAEAVGEDDHHPRHVPASVRRMAGCLHDCFVDAASSRLRGDGLLQRLLELGEIAGRTGEDLQLAREAVDGQLNILPEAFQHGAADGVEVQQPRCHDAVAEVNQEDDLRGHRPRLSSLALRWRPLDECDLLRHVVLEELKCLASEAIDRRFFLVDMQRNYHEVRLCPDDQPRIFLRGRRRLRGRERCDRQHCEKD